MAFSYYTLLTSTGAEAALVIGAFLALFLDLRFLRHKPLLSRLRAGAVTGVLTVLAALACLWLAPAQARLMEGMIVLDPLVKLIKGTILLLALWTILISLNSTHTPHVGEYLTLIFLATTGLLLLVGTEDLLMLFIALELTSLSLYLLTGFAKRDRSSAEAALKYFLFGGVSAAFTLFGIGLIYGLTETTDLLAISDKLANQPADSLLLVAMAMTVLGFAFKIAAAPLHLWAPDAYQGAPTPSAALIASASKLGSFFIFAKVMFIGFAGQEGLGALSTFRGGWVPLLAFLAAFSMLIGNFTAIAQTSVRRLLAYSAIAHTGYALLGFLPHNPQGLAALLYYVVTYSLTVAGAFGIVAFTERERTDDCMAAYIGLSHRAPVMAGCMLIFILSLAGIPPLPGFFGKFYLFTAATGGEKDFGLLWLVILAIAMSALSLYYYLTVLKQIYVCDGANPAEKIRIGPGAQAGFVLLALVVLVTGCLPDLLLGPLTRAIAAMPNW